VNDLPYLGLGGVVLARLKGERRQALQGNIPFVILTDLNLGSNKKQQIIIKFAIVLLFRLFTRSFFLYGRPLQYPHCCGSAKSHPSRTEVTEPVNYLAACLYAT
jgi:hypothetical protein